MECSKLEDKITLNTKINEVKGEIPTILGKIFGTK